MIKRDLKLAEIASEALQKLAGGELKITHVLGRRKTPLADDAESWRLDVRTTGGYAMSFQMEGCNVAWVREVTEPDGRRLLSYDNMPVSPLIGLNTTQQIYLDQVLLDAYCHVVGAE